MANARTWARRSGEPVSEAVTKPRMIAVPTGMGSLGPARGGVTGRPTVGPGVILSGLRLSGLRLAGCRLTGSGLHGERLPGSGQTGQSGEEDDGEEKPHGRILRSTADCNDRV